VAAIVELYSVPVADDQKLDGDDNPRHGTGSGKHGRGIPFM